MKKINVERVISAGLLGTAAMTMLMLVAPMMGVPPMNIGKMLGSMMGGVTALGWMAHFMIGMVLTVGYALFFASRLPGPYPAPASTNTDAMAPAERRGRLSLSRRFS